MAASGGHWVKIAQADIGTLQFVPKGKTVASMLAGVQPKPAAFPDNLKNLQVIKGLGGSTGAKLVQDSGGNLYVQKKGKDAGHLLEESAADKAYQALGLNVPEHKILDTPLGPVKLARFTEGQTLDHAMHVDQVAAKKATEYLASGFAADAMLGNWDVVGLGFDNVLIGTDGKTYRIDNGGALRRRAQGALKKNWDQYPDELFSMRNSSTNHQTASIFGGLKLSDIAKQAAKFGSKEKSLLSALPSALHGVVSGRAARMRQFSRIYNALSKKGHSDKAIEGYVKKLWAGLRTGKIKFDPQSAAQIVQSFGEVGG